MKTVSVSNLESYRRYCAGLCSYDSLMDDLLFFKENEKMRAGTELHKHIENGFIPDQFVTPCGITVIMPEGDFEVYGGGAELSANFESPHGVIVQGRVDAIDYDTVYDHKLTGSTKGYKDSFQWRFYLVMFGMRCFIYNIFRYGDIVNNTIKVKEFVSEEYTRYSGMEDECNDLIFDYMRYIEPELTMRKEALNAKR